MCEHKFYLDFIFLTSYYKLQIQLQTLERQRDPRDSAGSSWSWNSPMNPGSNEGIWSYTNNSEKRCDCSNYTPLLSEHIQTTARRCLMRTLSCCLLHVWRDRSGEAPDLILWKASEVHMWTRLQSSWLTLSSQPQARSSPPGSAKPVAIGLDTSSGIVGLWVGALSRWFRLPWVPLLGAGFRPRRSVWKESNLKKWNHTWKLIKYSFWIQKCTLPHMMLYSSMFSKAGTFVLNLNAGP